MAGRGSKTVADRSWRLPLAVFGAALLLRCLYVLSIRHAFFFDHLITEPAFYDGWARAIVSGNAPIHLPFDEAPGYPYVVALVYAVGGRSVIAVTLLQAAIGAASCAAIAVVARRCAGELAGWIAGTIASIYGPFLYFTGQLEPAVLAVGATCLGLVAMPTRGDAALRRWVAAGVAWALAIVVRPELAIVVPFAVAQAWFVGGRRAAGCTAAVPALLVAVSLAANTAASGHVVVLTNGAGVNLWLGNNPDADGVNPFVHGRLTHVVDEVEASTADPVDRDRAFRAHAEASAPLLAKKLVWTFSSRELPNAADIHWETEQSWLFVRPVFPLAFALVFPLACAGLALRRWRWREHVALLGPIVAAVAACVVFFTNARFRIVMVPSLIVLAASAVEPIARSLRHPRADARRTLCAAIGFATGIAIAWPGYFGVAHFRIAAIDANTGQLELAAGNYAAAERYLRSAAQRDPEDEATRLLLQEVLRRETTLK